jgi:CRISPR-associated protein Csb2
MKSPQHLLTDPTLRATVGYRRTTDLAPRPYAAFALYQPTADARRTFSAHRAVAVAGMVRHLAGKMARQTGHHDPERDLDSWVNEYVMGHAEGETDCLRPRFSYLPLPTIRPPNVLGGVNRVLIAEPPGGAGRHAAWASQALRGQVLISTEQREEAILMRADDWVFERYVGQSDCWATVTPVVLPGSDDGKFAKAEQLFLKALGHAGYAVDGLAELEFSRTSFWPRGEPAWKFQRPDYLRKGRTRSAKDHLSVYHVRLRWQQPIRGPIAIGAGRHCGLGILAAVSN